MKAYLLELQAEMPKLAEAFAGPMHNIGGLLKPISKVMDSGGAFLIVACTFTSCSL